MADFTITAEYTYFKEGEGDDTSNIGNMVLTNNSGVALARNGATKKLVEVSADNKYYKVHGVFTISSEASYAHAGETVTVQVTASEDSGRLRLSKTSATWYTAETCSATFTVVAGTTALGNLDVFVSVKGSADGTGAVGDTVADGDVETTGSVGGKITWSLG